jgi:GT2 family glycosyltransferase
MTRPGVTVVMPFAGSAPDGARALAVLAELVLGAEDELILSDNSGLGVVSDRVRVVSASGERSPSHARNVGAEHATREWVLFLDADCRPVPDILERYFAEPVDDDVGALAGEVVPAADGAVSLAERYGIARSFLGQAAHLAHPYLPRAVAANLLVRRRAFEAVGGFYEGVRAAEDTDFSWRLQRAGWRLVARPQAYAEHRYRTSLGALRRQWRGYAAGRAWLSRRYEDFEPKPAVRRAGARLAGRLRHRSDPPAADPRPGASRGPMERRRFAVLDAVLGLDELTGFVLSNRPAHRSRAPARVVLVAERFPARGDPLADFARSLAGARVEAAARPESFDQAAARSLPVDYREDDGIAMRALSLIRLVLRHPLRCLLDLLRRGGGPPLSALAPAVSRLQHEPAARVHPLGAGQAQSVARRMARLAGRALEDGGR